MPSIPLIVGGCVVEDTIEEVVGECANSEEVGCPAVCWFGCVMVLQLFLGLVVSGVVFYAGREDSVNGCGESMGLKCLIRSSFQMPLAKSAGQDGNFGRSHHHHRLQPKVSKGPFSRHMTNRRT